MWSIFSSTKRARSLSYFGTGGSSLGRKLVKPINLVSSRTTHQADVDQRRLIKTEPLAGAGNTTVLRETDARVRQEEPRLDLADGLADQGSVFLALLFSDGGPQVL